MIYGVQWLVTHLFMHTGYDSVRVCVCVCVCVRMVSTVAHVGQFV